jgi:hypothetical protein
MWSGALPEHQLAGLPALSSTLLATAHKSINVELNIYRRLWNA